MQIRVCGQCSFSRKENTFLKSLVKSAHEGVRWTCDACDQTKCEECSYTTKIKDSMKRHTARREIRENSSFVCDQCSYISKQKGNLDIHVRSKHKGEIIKCEICNYSATQLSNLRRHRRAKHKELLPT